MAVSEGSLVNSLRQVLWGVKWTFIPPSFPRPRNSFKRQRKILIHAILWLENCTWNWPLPSFFLGKAESGDVAVKCCTEWLDSILYKYKMKIAQGLVLKTGDTLPRKRKKNVYTISALVSFACIIYVIPTNYLGLAPSKSQNGGFIGGYIFPLTSCTAIKPASQRCELTYFRYSWIKVITLLICNTNYTQPRVNGYVSISLQPDSMPQYMKVFVSHSILYPWYHSQR